MGTKTKTWTTEEDLWNKIHEVYQNDNGINFDLHLMICKKFQESLVGKNKKGGEANKKMNIPDNKCEICDEQAKVALNDIEMNLHFSCLKHVYELWAKIGKP